MDPELIAWFLAGMVTGILVGILLVLRLIFRLLKRLAQLGAEVQERENLEQELRGKNQSGQTVHDLRTWPGFPEPPKGNH